MLCSTVWSNSRCYSRGCSKQISIDPIVLNLSRSLPLLHRLIQRIIFIYHMMSIEQRYDEAHVARITVWHKETRLTLGIICDVPLDSHATQKF